MAQTHNSCCRRYTEFVTQLLTWQRRNGSKRRFDQEPNPNFFIKTVPDEAAFDKMLGNSNSQADHPAIEQLNTAATEGARERRTVP